MGQIQEKQVKFRSPGQILMAGVDVQPNSSERHLPPRKPSLRSHVLSLKARLTFGHLQILST